MTGQNGVQTWFVSGDQFSTVDELERVDYPGRILAVAVNPVRSYDEQTPLDHKKSIDR